MMVAAVQPKFSNSSVDPKRPVMHACCGSDSLDKGPEKMKHKIGKRRGSQAPQASYRAGGMKSGMWLCITAETLLSLSFTALAMPVGWQSKPMYRKTNKPKHQKYRLVDLGT